MIRAHIDVHKKYIGDYYIMSLPTTETDIKISSFIVVQVINYTD